MKKINFKKIFKSVFGYFYPKSHGDCVIKLARDWNLILAFFMILLISVFFAGIVIFQNTKERIGAEIEASGEAFSEIADKELIKDIVREINDRKSEFENDLTRPKIEDPSL